MSTAGQMASNQKSALKQGRKKGKRSDTLPDEKSDTKLVTVDGKEYVNDVEVVDLEPDFTVSRPSEYIAFRCYVVLEKPWYNFVKELIDREYEPSDRQHGFGFSSIMSFIENAVREKQERTFVDYPGLGRLMRKHMQDKFQPCHFRIKGLNDEIFPEERN